MLDMRKSESVGCGLRASNPSMRYLRPLFVDFLCLDDKVRSGVLGNTKPFGGIPNAVHWRLEAPGMQSHVISKTNGVSL